jgi:hypothetical protein
MRLKIALLTTALAFGLGMPAALAQAGAPADEAPAAAQDEENQGAPEEGGAAAPNSDESGASELPPPASE